ncbi:NUDIX domain-containing protein [Bacillus salacetis]|uniref:NUDIX domain-containing protein n=1 Tax=Bacillus salacetis TaxID=2315464 RepID=A0A3A1R0Q1_9BACI|nr:NUDIX domain-containing protein [Bacillus salacetis]RIW35082.1 NUDIX domain-containing protein [Bacillus salacetis]
MTYPIRVRAGALIMTDKRILLVKFEDENGVHYNLPSGGVEKGESTIEAAVREAKEEAGVEVKVEKLAFIYEYAPHHNDELYGSTPNLSLFYECSIRNGSSPSMPGTPDVNQTGVEWINFTELDSITLYPKIHKQIKDYAAGLYEMDLIEECSLMK